MTTSNAHKIQWSVATRKLTPESFVKVWQSSVDYDHMLDTLANAARELLMEDLLSAQRLLEWRQSEAQAFSRGDLNSQDKYWYSQRDKVLKGEEIFVSEWNDADWPLRSVLPDSLKPKGGDGKLWSGYVVCPPEIYAQYLNKLVAMAESKVDTLKNYVCNPLKERCAWSDSYVPTGHALRCRSKIFRKKGVMLKVMDGLERNTKKETPKTPTWKDLQDIACEALK